MNLKAFLNTLTEFKIYIKIKKTMNSLQNKLSEIQATIRKNLHRLDFRDHNEFNS